MKKYTEKNPVFSTEIQITEISDPAHADNINAAPIQLFQNTLVNHTDIEKLKKDSNEVEFDDTGTRPGIPGESGGNPGESGENPGEVPDPAETIEHITSGNSVPVLIGHIKTALKGLLVQSQSIFGEISVLTGMIAGKYSADKAYDSGEYCIYDKSLYRFISRKESGDWDPDKVKMVTVAGELFRAIQQAGSGGNGQWEYDPEGERLIFITESGSGTGSGWSAGYDTETEMLIIAAGSGGNTETETVAEQAADIVQSRLQDKEITEDEVEEMFTSL